MQTSEEICGLMRRFIESMPRKVMTRIEKTNIGIVMVLRCLIEANLPVSACDISSRYMDVSTARAAALLRTMSEKGPIVKSCDPSDARKTIAACRIRGGNATAGWWTNSPGSWPRSLKK